MHKVHFFACLLAAAFCTVVGEARADKTTDVGLETPACVAHCKFDLFEMAYRVPEAELRVALTSPDMQKRMKGFAMLRIRLGFRAGEDRALLEALQTEKNPVVLADMADSIQGDMSDRAFLPILHAYILSDQTKQDPMLSILWAIGRIKDPSSVPVIALKLEQAKRWVNPNGIGVQFYADTLGEIGNPSAVPVLRKLARTKMPDRRATYAAWVVGALGQIGDPSTVDIVLGVLRSSHPDSEEARMTILALERLKVSWTADYVHPFLKNRFVKTREAAVRALGNLRNFKSRPLLLQILQTDDSWRVRREAALALAQYGSPDAVEALGDSLKKESHPLVRQAVAQSLGLIGGSRCGRILLDAKSTEQDGLVQNAIQNSFSLVAVHNFP